jgi:hypothetical protein
LLHLEIRVDSLILESMHVHDVSGDLVIFIVILFIKDDEEDVKTRHDRGRDVHVESEGSVLVVSTKLRVSSGQN